MTLDNSADNAEMLLQQRCHAVWSSGISKQASAASSRMAIASCKRATLPMAFQGSCSPIWQAARTKADEAAIYSDQDRPLSKSGYSKPDSPKFQVRPITVDPPWSLSGQIFPDNGLLIAVRGP